MKNCLTATASILALASAFPALAAETPATEAPPAPKWESSAALGLTVTGGNSETLLGTVNIATGKKWDKNELSFGVDGAYGESEINDEKEETANSIRGVGQYNRLFTERLYGYAKLDALYDAIADIDYRFTFSPGIGYYFIKNERTTLSGEVGPGYIVEKVGGTEDDYVILRVGEKFTFKISETARLWQSAEYLPQVDDFENFIVNFEVGIEADLSKSLSLRSFIQDTYDNVPAPDRKENDFKWVTAVAYKF